MPKNLLVGVLGLQNAGKSKTWEKLFGRSPVRTGKHRLTVQPGESVETFLVAGSPEERHKPIEEILNGQDCRIVLCSMQYVDRVQRTLDYFARNHFLLFVQWLNPARGRYEVPSFDELGLGNKILSKRSVFSIRDAQCDPTSRVREISEFIYGWAKPRNLVSPS